MPAYIDLVFSDKADATDLDIITPATPDAPGLARLAAAAVRRGRKKKEKNFKVGGLTVQLNYGTINTVQLN